MKDVKRLLFVLAVAASGCSDDYQPRESRTAAAGEARAPAAAAAKKMVRQTRGDDAFANPSVMQAMVTDGTVATSIAMQPEATVARPTGAPITRKIIYDAQLDLLVDSVDAVARKLTGLVQNARGYIAEQSIAGSPGSARSMHWRLRVPVDAFDAFVESVVALGELERHNRTSQDITEQYYDVEARVKNKKVEEQTLNKILQERSGKLEDVLKIEIELSRVRGEIEQLEGKLRVLENLSALATLTLNIREREKYAPPAPVVASFPTQIGRAWESSILGFVDHGKALVLWVVTWALWMPIWLAGGILAWIVLRRLWRALFSSLLRLIALARTSIARPSTPAASE